MPATLLVVASDVGTANFLAPVLPSLPVSWRVFAHPEAAGVFANRGIDCSLIERAEWGKLEETARLLLQKNEYAAVVAGTSWGLTLDKAITIAARSNNLRSVAIIEHWSLYRERFSRVADGRIVEADKFLPDYVWVNDEIALREASEAGLPISRLRVVGQPHLETLHAQLEKFKGEPRDNRTVFVSERLKDDFIADSPLHFGFDEYSALDGLIAALPTKSRLVIKLHPQEPVDKYNHLRTGKTDIEIVGQVPIDRLIGTSGRIVGMLSMLLMEAALLRDDIVSFMPRGRPSDFVGNRIGATHCITSVADLAAELASPMHGAKHAKFGARFSGSTARVISSLTELTCA